VNRTEHLLTQAAEECAEIAQRCSKAARFGLSEVQEGQPYNNAKRIVIEFGDLLGVLELLENDGHIDLDPRGLDVLKEAKKKKIEQYMAYAEKCGTLTVPEGACCANEKRTMADGCETCGDPCI
jgi:hypothetical protein